MKGGTASFAKAFYADKQRINDINYRRRVLTFNVGKFDKRYKVTYYFLYGEVVAFRVATLHKTLEVFRLPNNASLFRNTLAELGIKDERMRAGVYYERTGSGELREYTGQTDFITEGIQDFTLFEQ